MQSLPSTVYSWLPALIASLCIVRLMAACKETVRWESSYVNRSLWARNQPYFRRNAERRSGRERKLGWAETVGGSSYRREMVSYDATRYAERLFEAFLRTHGHKKLERTER